MKQKLVLLLIILLSFSLRFYKLPSNPPSLYWEEVALGYDAYSLLKTGKDHRGNVWPITYINSYMDYKPPLYVYTAIPSIALFGLNEFGVRFPSAFFGSLTVLVLYFLVKELTKYSGQQLEKNNLPLVSALLLAISPWHLQFSRAAFEANLALFLVTFAILVFLWSFKKPLLLIISALLFVLSLYAYHGARVFTPLCLLALIVVFFKRLWRIKIIVLLSAIFFVILSIPLLKSLTSKEIGQRFQETSAFIDLDPIIKSNAEIQKDENTRLAKIIHHRYFEYGKIFLTNYFNHFSGDFLFLSGDGNPRHSIQEFGALYHWELITLIIGLIYFIKVWKPESNFILLWLLLGPVPGAITKSSPHALRSIFTLPALIIISAIGLVQLIKIVKFNKIILFTFYFLLFADFIFYLHFYYVHYPKYKSSYWQYGYKQAIAYIEANKAKYNTIYITNEYGRAYMYYLFFSQMDPLKAQAQILPFKDLPDIPQIGNVYFYNPPLSMSKELLVNGPGGDTSGLSTHLVTINDLNNQSIFEIWEKI